MRQRQHHSGASPNEAIRRLIQIAALYAGLHELLGPGVIKALGNALAPAQLRNAVLAAQAIEHDPDFVFGGKMPPRRPQNSP